MSCLTIMYCMRASNNYMPPEQLDQVLQAIPTLHIRKWKDEDIQMLFQICYWCALRIGEALRLDTVDFDLSIGKVYLGKTKANVNDDAAIPISFIPQLRDFLNGKTGPLFPGLTYKTVYKWLVRLGQELDIKAWTTLQSETGEKTKSHIFRKSLAKDQMYGTYGRKADLGTISKTLRHKGKNPLASTMHYIKADSEAVSDYWKDLQ